MSARARRTAPSYARAVERAFAMLVGRATVLSPRDWALVASWESRGVPLACVLETIEAARAKHRAPRTLAALAREVEAAWEGVRSGRATAPAEEAEALPGIDETLERWRRAAEAEPPGSSLRALIERASAMAVTLRDPESVDAFVDDELPGAVPGEWFAQALDQADRALRSFQGRMPERVFEATRHRSVIDRLRERADLPRLKLSR